MRYIYTLAILFLFNTTFAQFQENILKDSMVNFIGEIELVDLDLDGEKDIVYSYFRDIYYLKNSNGSFQDIHVLNRAGNSIDNFEVYDDDNDGDLDFFMVRYLQNKVEVLRNAGALSFSYAASINATNWYEIDQVIMNDINKDGTVEAIISSTYDNKTAIYTRNANGTYSAPVNSYQSGTTEWEVCNLDMDTFPDFRSTNRWLESNIVGGYTFDWDPLYIDHVGLGDVDGDGDDDLIGLDSDNRLLYFQNDYPNSSSFLSSVMIDSLTATELAVSDISGDGLADIVLLSFSESKILWLQNLGSGQFSAPQIISDTFYRPYHIKIDDLDNDGRNDLVVASETSGNGTTNKISWFKNNTLITNISNTDAESLNIFPNPTSDFVNINASNGQAMEYIIFDLNGRTVKQGATSKNRIKIEEIKHGFYMLRLFVDNSIQDHKLIIQ